MTLVVTPRARHVQRRVVADAGHRVDGGAGLHQGRDHLGVAPLGRPVQGRHAVPVGGVDVRAVLEQRADRVHVSDARRVGDRRVARRRREAADDGHPDGRRGGEERSGDRLRDTTLRA